MERAPPGRHFWSISDGRDGRQQTDGLTTPEEKERRKKRGGVRYVTQNHLRRTAGGRQGPCDWISPVRKRSCCTWLTGNSRWYPPKGFRQKPSVVFCGLLLSWRKTKDEGRENARAREGERGRSREIVAWRGWAGGKSWSSVQSPFASRKSLCTLFFFPTGFSALNPGTYLCGLLLFISFFLQRVCVCVCFIGCQLFCRGIAKHHELVIWVPIMCFYTLSEQWKKRKRSRLIFIELAWICQPNSGMRFFSLRKRASVCVLSRLADERERERESLCVCLCVGVGVFCFFLWRQLDQMDLDNWELEKI